MFRSRCVLADFLGALLLGSFLSKKSGQMLLDGFSCLDGKARRQRIQVRICIDLSRIEVQFFAPYELRLLTLFDDGIKEPPKHVEAIARADPAEAGMIRKRLIQIVTQIPANAQAISGLTNELPFGADALEKHHQLQFEKDDRINGGTALAGIGLVHKFAHEREVKRSLQVTIEVTASRKKFTQ